MRKLYLILARELNYVKIGISNNPQNRLKQLQTSSPTPLELFAFKKSSKAPTKEKTLHEKFKNKNIKGEWFRLDAIDYIKILKDWDYDPGIHFSKRTKDNLKVGDTAFFSWDSRSLCSVKVIQIDNRHVTVKILKKIGHCVGYVGAEHYFFLDEVRHLPIDALANRITL